MSDIVLGEPVPGWAPPPWPARTAVDGIYARLEPLDAEAHAASLFEANAADDAIWRWLPYGPFPGFAAYRDWLAERATGDDPLFFAVVEKASGRALGVASYLRIQPERGTIEVGHICYSPALQRTRAGTEAMWLMMRNAVALGYRRYEWKCDALNAPSRRLAQRLGLSFEGVWRQADVVKGRNRDTAWYATIDREAPALARAFETWLDPANFDAQGRQKRSLSELTRPILVSRD